MLNKLRQFITEFKFKYLALGEGGYYLSYLKHQTDRPLLPVDRQEIQEIIMHPMFDRLLVINPKVKLAFQLKKIDGGIAFAQLNFESAAATLGLLMLAQDFGIDLSDLDSK